MRADEEARAAAYREQKASQRAAAIANQRSLAGSASRRAALEQGTAPLQRDRSRPDPRDVTEIPGAVKTNIR